MLRIFRVLLLSAICIAYPMHITANDSTDSRKLQAEMLRYISTTDREKFMGVTEQLKKVSQKENNERLFYTAWANQAVYEATHQYYTQAAVIARELEAYAKQQDSRFGQYSALHALAVIELQKQDYDAAEQAFQKAVDYRHRYFPNESAADDIQEQMKIANHRKDAKAGEKYARQILAEPNVAPIHKGRALFRLSQLAFARGQKEEYNRIYQELADLRARTGIGTIEPIVEVNYNIINGNYAEALRLCQQLSEEKKADRMALIYHKLGDDTKAYEQMVKFKKINDSIVLVSHGNVVASCYVQMNNERMKLEQNLLEEQNQELTNRLYFTLAAAAIIILGLLVYQRQQRVKRLQVDNAKLGNELEKTEKALDVKNEFLSNITNELRAPLHPINGFSDLLGIEDYEMQPEERVVMSGYIKNSSKVLTKLIDEMAEYSFFESKKSLPLNTTLSPNMLCMHMIDAMKGQCKEGVQMKFETTIPDTLMVKVNMDAMEHLLKHLLDNAIRFTDKGNITIRCEETETGIRTSVTDTGRGIDPSRRDHVFEMFTDEGDNARLTGMGLPICQSIVRLLGGRIWYDKEYTDGARFVFELPEFKAS